MPVHNTVGTYTEKQGVGYAGFIPDGSSYEADSRTLEGANASVGFGLAVAQGTGERGVILASSAANQFVGVTVADNRLPPSQEDKYATADTVTVLYRGRIMVQVDGAVAAGNDVTYHKTTGELGTTAVGANHYAIAGARWLTTAADNGLAIVQLSGELPGD